MRSNVKHPNYDKQEQNKFCRCQNVLDTLNQSSLAVSIRHETLLTHNNFLQVHYMQKYPEFRGAFSLYFEMFYFVETLLIYNHS